MITAEILDDKIKLTGEGRFDLPGLSFVDGDWVLPLSFGSCVMLREEYGDDLEIGPVLLQWATDEKARIDEALEARSNGDGPTPEIHEPEYDPGIEDVKPKKIEDEWWFDLWQGMPEFLNYDVSPWRTVKVHFRNKADLEEFQKRLGFRVTKWPVRTGVIWFPPAEDRGNEWRYTDEP